MSAALQDPRLADLDGGLGTYAVSIFQQLETGLLANPDEVAVVVVFQLTDHLSELTAGIPTPVRKSGCLKWTYSQLHGAAMRLARGLLAKGVNTTSTVAIFLPSGIEFCVWLWTVAILKMPLSALDPDVLQPERHEELQALMSSLDPAVVVTLGEEHDLRAYATGAHPPSCLWITASARSRASVSMVDLAAAGRQYNCDEDEFLEIARQYQPHLVAYYTFTSGTSVGRPKGCIHTVLMAAHCLRNWQSWETAPGTRVVSLAFSATFRVSALYSPTRTWSLGGTVVMPCTSFDQGKVLDAAEEFHCTNFGGTPSVLRSFIISPDFRTRKLESIDTVTMGADTITPAAIAMAQEAFPRARVAVLYGMTEGAALLHWPFSTTRLEDIPLVNEILPMGRIKAGARLRVRDVETGDIVLRNEPGEVIISGDNVIKSYLGGVHPESFFNDDVGRWYCTGDLGLVSDQGLVYILGRSKDIIKRSGATLVPGGMESCLQKFTGSQVTVVAVPSSEHGHEPYAVLTDFGGKTVAELRAEVVRMCDAYHVLAGAVELKQLGLERFPLNPTGKIVKTQVQEALLKYLRVKE